MIPYFRKRSNEAQPVKSKFVCKMHQVNIENSKKCAWLEREMAKAGKLSPAAASLMGRLVILPALQKMWLDRPQAVLHISDFR